MTEQATLRRQSAIRAYVHAEYRSEKSASRHFDLYDINPRELEPKQRAIVKQSYQIADDILDLAARVADKVAEQQDRDHGAANTGGAEAVAAELRADSEEARAKEGK